MTMRDRYTTSPVPDGTWDVPITGDARFNWEYDDGRDRLLSLYQKGKDKQWDAQKRIDWDLPVDPDNVDGLPEEFNPLLGSDLWERMSQEARDEFGRHQGSWLFSQFLHGEQGALTVSARIVRDRAGPGLEVLRRDAGHGRGAPRRAVRQVHRREDRDVLPDQPGPRQAPGGVADRQPLGPAVPRHAGAHRGPRPRRVRPLPRHVHQPAGQAAPRVRHAGRGPARGVRPAGTEGLLRGADHQGTRRTRGVRRRGLLPHARPVPGPGGLRDARHADRRVHELRQQRSDATRCTSRCCSAASSRASATSACGATRCRRRMRTWACSTTPRATWSS